MNGSRPPLILLTGFVAPYRVPVYEELARLLPGTEVWVSAKSESDRDWQAVLPAGVTVRRMSGWTIPAQHIPGRSQDLHLPLGALRDLRRARPRVVVSGEMGLRTALAWLFRRTTRDSRLILWATLSERTERGRSGLRGVFRRGILTGVDAVLVNGASGARYVRTLNQRVRVVPMNQAAPAVTGPPRSGEPKQGLQLLAVGQLIPRKGLHLAIPQLGRWSRSRGVPAKLTLIGSGSERDELAALADREGLPVEVCGSLPYDLTLAEYAEADALLFPTLEDEWGLVVNEALGAGRPVVGSVHAQAVLELVNEGVNGVRFDPELQGDLSSALDRLMVLLDGDPAALAQRCCESVADVTPGAMARCIAALVHDLAGGDAQTSA
jgi:hypothetical protein